MTSRPDTDRIALAEWLGQQGITIGMDDADVIAAVWFTGARCTSSFKPEDKDEVATSSTDKGKPTSPSTPCKDGAACCKLGCDKVKVSTFESASY